VMPFLLKNLAEEKIVITFRLLLKWYSTANRRGDHTEVSLAELEKDGHRFVQNSTNFNQFSECCNLKFDKLIYIYFRLVQHLLLNMPEQKSSWRLVKIHALSHYADDIRRGGVTSEFSAEMWESLHKTLMKQPYRGSNKKNTDSQIMAHHARQWSVNQMNTLVDNSTVTEEAGEDEEEELSNILPQKKKMLNLIELTSESHPHSEKWARFQSAIDLYLKIYYPDGIEIPKKVCKFMFHDILLLFHAILIFTCRSIH